MRVHYMYSMCQTNKGSLSQDGPLDPTPIHHGQALLEPAIGTFRLFNVVSSFPMDPEWIISRLQFG